MTAWTWGSWPDPVVDHGQGLYAAWRVSEGEVLYRDLAWFHGPLSVYLGAALMLLFGVGIWTLAGFNLVVTAATTALVVHLGRRLGGRLVGTGAGLVFVLVFAFGGYLPIGTYNYVAPYTQEITHGLVLALAALALLDAGTAQDGRRRDLLVGASGLALGLVFLTKAEVFLAAASGLGAMLGAATSLPPRALPRRRSAGLFAAGAILPPVVATLAFTLVMPAGAAIRSAAGAYRFVFEPAIRDLAFYRGKAGLEDPTTELVRLGIVAVFAAVALGPMLWVAGRREARSFHAFLAALPLAAALLLWRSVPWLQLGRLLPVIALLTALWIAVRLVRGKDRATGLETPWGLVTPLGLGFAVFGAGLLCKMPLSARVYHYGFVLALPATLLLLPVLLDAVPRALDRRRGTGRWFRRHALALGALVVVAHLVATGPVRARRQATVGSAADTFRSDGRGVVVNQAADELAHLAVPGDTVLVVPDGVMLAYLARVPSASSVLSWVPTEVAAYGEAALLAELRDDPPTFVALVDKSTAEFGFRTFGVDYASDAMRWIVAEYEPVALFGAPPLQGRGFGVALLRRRGDGPTEPATPPDSTQ